MSNLKEDMFEIIAVTFPNLEEKNSLQEGVWACDSLESAEWLIGQQFPHAKKRDRKEQGGEIIARYDHSQESVHGNIIETEITILRSYRLP